MATEPAEGAVLRQLLNAAKQQEMSFAFAAGGKNEGILLLDRRTPPSALFKDVRKHLRTAKTACGTLQYDGNSIFLNCEANFAGVEKQMAQHLRANGVNAAVALGQTAAPDKAAPEPATDQEPESAEELEPEPQIEELADKNAAPLRRASESWRAARKTITQDLRAQLEGVAAATGDMPEYQHAAANVAKLAQPLVKLDNSLNDLLDHMAKTDDAAQRRKLAQAARQRVRDHVTLLNSEFCKYVDDSGFAATKIRETALRSLQNVNEALKNLD